VVAFLEGDVAAIDVPSPSAGSVRIVLYEVESAAQVFSQVTVHDTKGLCCSRKALSWEFLNFCATDIVFEQGILGMDLNLSQLLCGTLYLVTTYFSCYSITGLSD